MLIKNYHFESASYRTWCVHSLSRSSDWENFAIELGFPGFDSLQYSGKMTSHAVPLEGGTSGLDDVQAH